MTHSAPPPEAVTTPAVLDPASGSRMFYFDKSDPRVVFGDIRRESHILCDGRALEVNPDEVMDFRYLPYADGSFRVVVFDPPHLIRAGERSWTFKKYGVVRRIVGRRGKRTNYILGIETEHHDLEVSVSGAGRSVRVWLDGKELSA